MSSLLKKRRPVRSTRMGWVLYFGSLLLPLYGFASETVTVSGSSGSEAVRQNSASSSAEVIDSLLPDATLSVSNELETENRTTLVTVTTQNNAPHEAFILFYMASCPHCQRFDPILKKYAITHHMPVLAYTLDGKSLPSFPKSVLPSQTEINRFFPNRKPVVPTLFLMDLDQHNIIPVLQGEATFDQLDHRMKQIRAQGGRYAH